MGLVPPAQNMTTLFTTVLFAIYNSIFPHFISEEAELKGGPVAHVTRRAVRHPRLARVVAHIQLNYYMPIFQPVMWWRHIIAINKLLDDIGWIDIDL